MATLSLIRRPIESELADYKKVFDATLQHPDGLLGSALTHIRNRQGKMMRPILVLLTAKATRGVNETAIHSAVTLELLHTASLVHDDIVDESDERRGQASVNAVYDNKVAVLVGDYLLSSSLEQAALTGDAHIVAQIALRGRNSATVEHPYRDRERGGILYHHPPEDSGPLRHLRRTGRHRHGRHA